MGNGRSCNTGTWCLLALIELMTREWGRRRVHARTPVRPERGRGLSVDPDVAEPHQPRLEGMRIAQTQGLRLRSDLWAQSPGNVAAFSASHRSAWSLQINRPSDSRRHAPINADRLPGDEHGGG